MDDSARQKEATSQLVDIVTETITYFALEFDLSMRDATIFTAVFLANLPQKMDELPDMKAAMKDAAAKMLPRPA